MNRMRRMMALGLALALMAVVLLPAVSFAKSDLHKGSRGDEVKALQEQLNALGYDVGKPDGDFGGKTETALKQFQESKELEVTGRLDTDTYRALFGKEPPMEVWERPREPETGIHRYDYFISDCDWEEANRRAVDMGGWLVGINSMSEYVEIQSEIVELGYSDVSFWIGVRRDLDQSPGGFYWSDEYGGNYEMPIDGRETLSGVNPWALGEPSYVSADGEQELYTRLRFSEGEARWVWDNCDGVPAKDKRQGYIVEYPEKSVVATAEMVRGQVMPEQTPALTVRQEPEPRPRPEAATEYSAKLLQVAGGNLIFLVSTVDECAMYVEYYNNGRKLYWQWNTVDGGLRNRVIHIPIREDAYDYLTPLFTVKYQLVAYGPNADDIGGAFIDKQEYVLPEAMDIEPVEGDPTLAPEAMETWGSGDGEMEQETAQRVTVERQSDPTRRDSDDEVQIVDADTEDPIVLVNPNIPFYLQPGTYVIHDPNDPDSDTVFTVLDSPVRPVIRDMEPGTLEGTLVDAATGQPLPGVTVTVEVQGVAYTTVTDENGHFSFNNLVPVDAMITVSCEGYASVTRMITVGSGMNAPLEIACEAYPKATFLGYWHDISAAAEAAVNDYWDQGGRGWALWKNMYIEVAEGITASAPASGTVLNCQGDEARPFVRVSSEEARDEFFSEINLNPSVAGELLLISGTIRKDNTKANNPGYGYVYEGYSDTLIDIETMEPVNDAGRRILEQCRENGTNPLEDETLRAIIVSKYDDEATAQAALAELADAEPEARDKQLEKLLK